MLKFYILAGTSWLLACGVTESSELVNAQAVVWRDTTSRDAVWQCSVLVRNITKEDMKIPRFPSSYTVTVDVSEREQQIKHYDSFEATYPEGFVKLAPGKVVLYELVLPGYAHLPGKPASLTITVEVHASGRKHDCSVSCPINKFLGKREREEWIEKNKGQPSPSTDSKGPTK
jgi:hypothetical protein